MKKGDRDQQSQVGGIPLDCRYGNHEMDSFCPTDPWDQTPNSNINFYEPNTSSLMGMASMVSHFAINGNNDGTPPPFDPYCNPTTRAVVSQSRRNHNGVVMVGGIGEGPSDDVSVGDGQGMQDSGNLQGVGISGNDSGNTNPASGSQEYPPSKALAAKKRKTSAQEVGMEHVKEEGCNDEDRDGDGSNQRNEQEGTLKLSGKHGKEKMDLQKEDYIHVRARRGQATNSHSLAERVRREKISERMKLLQDLVPGCNKVTGKAVMLDEIINYVQSLQRQVEFLSMKLAAINPQLNFNIEGLLSKDVLQSHTGPSSSTPGFPPDMVHPFLHQNLQDLIQTGNFGMPAPPDALRRSVSGQMASMNMLKESKSQVPMAWEGELHNGMQMNFSGSQPLNIQDINARSRDGFRM